MTHDPIHPSETLREDLDALGMSPASAPPITSAEVVRTPIASVTAASSRPPPAGAGTTTLRSPAAAIARSRSVSMASRPSGVSVSVPVPKPATPHSVTRPTPVRVKTGQLGLDPAPVRTLIAALAARVRHQQTHGPGAPRPVRAQHRRRHLAVERELVRAPGKARERAPAPQTGDAARVGLRRQREGAPGQQSVRGDLALGAGDNSDARRLELTAGYGIAMFGGRFTGTPEIGVGLSDGGRDYRLG